MLLRRVCLSAVLLLTCFASLFFFGDKSVLLRRVCLSAVLLLTCFASLFFFGDKSVLLRRACLSAVLLLTCFASLFFFGVTNLVAAVDGSPAIGSCVSALADFKAFNGFSFESCDVAPLRRVCP